MSYILTKAVNVHISDGIVPDNWFPPILLDFEATLDYSRWIIITTYNDDNDLSSPISDGIVQESLFPPSPLY